jgi:hypothetical protein
LDTSAPGSGAAGSVCYAWADACEASSVVSWTKPTDVSITADFDLTTKVTTSLGTWTPIANATDKIACPVTMSLSSTNTSNTTWAAGIYTLSVTTANNANGTTFPTFDY